MPCVRGGGKPPDFAQSAGGTNSSCNLALTTANKIKGDTFAYDFIQENFPEHWEAIKKDMEEMPKNKAWRFTAEAQARYALLGDETDEDYADRRLQDTRIWQKLPCSICLAFAQIFWL